MKKATNRVIILLLVLSCTACFDLQENLFLRKDGSGTFSFMIDMSQMKIMMSVFSNFENAFTGSVNTNEKKSDEKKNEPAKKIAESFDNTRKKLLNTKGVSNVKIIDDSIKYHFGISFEFKNIAVLNKAMNILFEEEDSLQTNKLPITYFQLKGDTLIRLEALDSKSIIGKSSSIASQNQNTDSNPLFDTDKLFGKATYSANYEFPEKIISVENNNAALSPNMKKVILKVYPFANPNDSTLKKQTIANVITFK